MKLKEMMTIIKKMVTNVNKCDYCDKCFSSRQSLHVHRKKRTKKCLASEQNKKADAIPKKTDVVSNKLSAIEKLKAQIKALEEAELTPQELEIIALKDALQEQKNINQSLSEEVDKYKKFYVKYMLDDTNTLEYFDNEYELEYAIEEKYTKRNFLLGVQGIVNTIFPYFYPKYIRCTDIKRGILKYKNKEGEILVDENCENLMKLVKCGIWTKGNELYNELISENVGNNKILNRCHDVFLKLTEDGYGRLFYIHFLRLIRLSDGVELGRNVELLNEALHTY